MQHHTMYLWHCFAITITKLDLERGIGVCFYLPQNFYFFRWWYEVEIFFSFTIDDFINDDINHLFETSLPIKFYILSQDRIIMHWCTCFNFSKCHFFSLCQRFIELLVGVLELIPPWGWENMQFLGEFDDIRNCLKSWDSKFLRKASTNK